MISCTCLKSETASIDSIGGNKIIVTRSGTLSIKTAGIKYGVFFLLLSVGEISIGHCCDSLPDGC